MARNYLFGFLMTAFFILTRSSSGYASDGGPKGLPHISGYRQLSLMLNDTIPDVKKIPGIATTDSVSKGSAIKVVPKSKRQAPPVAVPIPVKIKPIRVIKPKIIKPVIKIK
jgi:hypothetical protein